MPESFRRKPARRRVRFRQAPAAPFVLPPSRRDPQMQHAVADWYVAAPEIGPRLLSQPEQRLEPDLAIGFVMVVDASSCGGKGLGQIGAADDADNPGRLETDIAQPARGLAALPPDVTGAPLLPDPRLVLAPYLKPFGFGMGLCNLVQARFERARVIWPRSLRGRGRRIDPGPAIQ